MTEGEILIQRVTNVTFTRLGERNGMLFLLLLLALVEVSNVTLETKNNIFTVDMVSTYDIFPYLVSMGKCIIFPGNKACLN